MIRRKDLRNCPFCNGYPKLIRKNITKVDNEVQRNCYVICRTCDARGARILYKDYESASAAHEAAKIAWNRRV